MSSRRLSVILATILSLAAVMPALAHAHLVSAVPAPDSVVTVAPAGFQLQFTEAVERDFTDVIVTRDGAVVPHRAVVLDPADPVAISIGFDAPLEPGTYGIEWHAVATDGHKSSGTYGFTIAP